MIKLSKEQVINYIANYGNVIAIEVDSLDFVKYEKGQKWSFPNVDAICVDKTWFEKSEPEFGQVLFYMIGEVVLETPTKKGYKNLIKYLERKYKL